MEMNQVSLYVSPRSGFTYEVVRTDSYGWERWEILKDGRMVQFALTETQVPGQVRHLEQPGWDGWQSSRFD